MKYLIIKDRVPISTEELMKQKDFNRFINAYRKPMLRWFSMNIIAIMVSIPGLLFTLSFSPAEDHLVSQAPKMSSLNPFVKKKADPVCKKNNPNAPIITPEPSGEFRDDKALTLKRKEDQVLKVRLALPDTESTGYNEIKYEKPDLPVPHAFVCDVKSGSKVDIWDFSIKNNISVWDEKNRKNLPVLAFTILRDNGHGADTLRTKGDKFSLSMREAIFAMQPGSKLFIPDIVYLSTDGIPLTLHGSEVIVVDNRKRVGEK